ncbi:MULTISPECIES: dihydrolipoyl dehydrogenase [Christiangramia]|uniref:Dihydrolipoyl dehydrogenase n=1 Tax=Christiangramia flava JLT2011 TaxID=1229726 RepID=A0A1L7I963_9FLAO|nr:dihydrolipoyl dehydrogenase [Christiangramia flava]APU70151.1 Dihydrolipoamide dehydrogenase of 2-oxoglutarate dehydrogenase [Christiangramia flava JLT2011]OSS39638.1 Dihydrolipoamide dehydrogenase of 2-oxoglutarate dehydrogenase [Christiangramia flava JLT2011]
MEKYDITIIGSGPGGYVCAIRAAQLGFKVAIIERYSTLGGTCLNVGCIPSKAWLEASEHYHKLKHQFEDFGINVKEANVDIAKMNQRVQDVVGEIINGVAFLMKKNKVTVYEGHGTIKDKNTIEIKGEGKTQTIETDKMVIATGSKPASLPNIEIDKKRIISSTEALALKEIPKHLMVVGGGVIGVEIGSVFARLGSKVSIVEYFDGLIYTMDKSVGHQLYRSLRKQDIEFYLEHKVTKAVAAEDKVTLTAQNRKDDKEMQLEGDYCLMAIGRKPYTDNLGLENLEVATNDKGQIKVDDNLETKIKGVYAIGDVVRGAMLAHKASEEGVFVAERIAGQKPHINYSLIPNIVYTQPEVAGVGLTEEELKEAGRAIKTGSFPFKANARAKISMDTDGFIKVIADKETDEILGVHMIGPRIADSYTEAVVAMEFRAAAEDIARMSHGHPTFSETFKEACLAATEDRALHI